MQSAGHKLAQASHIQNYDHIVLTEDEVQDVLRRARREKAFKLQELEYAEKVRRSQEKKIFNWKQLRDFVLGRFPNLEIDQDNEFIFRSLCLYFSNDPEFEELDPDFSLEKGILLNGPMGCGKTFLMSVFNINTKLPYQVVECLEVAEDYSKKGEEYLQKYFHMVPAYPQQNLGHDLLGWCFDDLGWEDSKKHFGNNMNTMEYVLARAYSKNMKGKIHVTTNLDGEGMEKMYGPRLRSRMREMFNQLVFDDKAADRRK